MTGTIDIVIPKNEVVNGFCYAYTEALITKLETLVKTGKAFKDRPDDDENIVLSELLMRFYGH